MPTDQSRCRYCFAPLESDWRMVIVTRTRGEILGSTDLWAPDETIPLIRREIDEINARWEGEHQPTRTLLLEAPRQVRVRVDKAEFCSEVHAKAFKGNRSAVTDALGEFRDDDGETVDVGPVEIHPGQGQLL